VSQTPPPPSPAPNEANPPSDVSKLSVSRLLVIGLIGVVIFLAWKLTSTSPQMQAENERLRHELANKQAEADDLKKADALRKEEFELRRSDLKEAVAAAAEASQAVLSAEKAVGTWQRTTNELLTTDKGKPVAADPAALAKLRSLLGLERPDPAVAEALAKRLEPLKAFLAKAQATDDGSYAPSEDLMARVRSVGAEAMKAAETYEDHNRKLAAILAAAPVPAEPQTQTLEMALEDLERRFAAEEAAGILEAAEQARKERAEMLAAEKAKTEAEITAAQLKAAEAERAIKVRELADREAAAKAMAAEQQKLREAAMQKAELERKFQAALPEIRMLLQPFTNEGWTQPGRGEGYTRTVKKGPVSYSLLKGAGHLEKNVRAVGKFRYAASANGWNDRELGSFPVYGTYEKGAEAALRAQDLLNEFGELMVEKKMLAP